jgi:hypothetical protein
MVKKKKVKTIKRINLATVIMTLFLSQQAVAHHGVASLGSIGTEGPGAPVETSSSATLPEGSWLTFLKLDHAKFKTGLVPSPESDYNQYWMMGVGYGVKPWLSAYIFQPYNVKQDTAGGLNSQGFTDVSFMGVLGFKYDRGYQLVPAKESLDDLMDWHFTLYGGFSDPTGNANHRLSDGSIDPGKSLGFGRASFSYGMTATKQLTRDATLVMEAGQIQFQPYHYAVDPTHSNGLDMKFGTETRYNLALPYRLLANPEKKFRLDVSTELSYLALDRDIKEGVAALASGGRVLYGILGTRIYYQNMSFAVALKKPVWTELNESPLQQGAEGKEDYRFVATFSALF